ncbi:MAG TPA: hypothetical protein VF945_21265 [Polyangia bacterium]
MSQSIVAYLRSLTPVRHEIPPSSCPPLKSPPVGVAPDLAMPVAPPDLAAPPDMAAPLDLAELPDLWAPMD